MMHSALKSSESLLAPIPGSNAVGFSVRYTGVYDEIIEARREDDSSLPQGIWQTDLKLADWQKVEDICTEILRAKSKDLQIAAWLTEAWLHKNGLEGLTQGILLIDALCQRFWPNIHPQIKGNDVEFRLSPFEWANEKLSDKVVNIKITHPEKKDTPTCSLSDHLFMLNTTSETKAEKLNIEEFTASQRSTSNEFFQSLLANATNALEAISNLEKHINTNLKSDSLSMSRLQQVIRTLHKYAENCLRSRNISNDNQPEKEKPMSNKKAAPKPNKRNPLNSISSRQEAYQILAKVADYLEQAEPHSPTPYLVKKAIAWGEMNLSELLHEFIKNNMDLAHIQKWLGMPVEALDQASKEETPPQNNADKEK